MLSIHVNINIHLHVGRNISHCRVCNKYGRKKQCLFTTSLTDATIQDGSKREKSNVIVTLC